MPLYLSLETQPLIVEKSTKSEKIQVEESQNVDISKKGLTLLSASVFIAGEMAGSGVLALPKAIVNSGVIGILLLVVFCGNAAYGGIKLGKCWEIIEERYPEYRKGTRNPYSVIALKSVGDFGSTIVSTCIRITLFGAGTVYIILTSQIIGQILNQIFPSISACNYFIIIALCLIPPMWLASPKEFSLVGFGALLTTVISCILFFMQILEDGKTKVEPVKHKIHGFQDFFLSFGTLLFAFGGASTFPTIQNDMKNKSQFTYSVIIAFIVILMLYIPITAGGFFVYGEDVNDNLTFSLSKSLIVSIGNILMAAHLVFAFLIVTNPVSQELEEAFNIPKHFNWKRCVVRTIMVLVMIIIGETIPQFGKILSLVGGSAITLLTFVFPPYFYMKLCDMDSPEWNRRYSSLPEKIYMWELIGIGLIGGCASTYSAINSILAPDASSTSCLFIN